MLLFAFEQDREHLSQLFFRHVMTAWLRTAGVSPRVVSQPWGYISSKPRLRAELRGAQFVLDQVHQIAVRGPEREADEREGVAVSSEPRPEGSGQSAPVLRRRTHRSQSIFWQK